MPVNEKTASPCLRAVPGSGISVAVCQWFVRLRPCGSAFHGHFFELLDGGRSRSTAVRSGCRPIRVWSGPLCQIHERPHVRRTEPPGNSMLARPGGPPWISIPYASVSFPLSTSANGLCAPPAYNLRPLPWALRGNEGHVPARQRRAFVWQSSFAPGPCPRSARVPAPAGTFQRFANRIHPRPPGPELALSLHQRVLPEFKWAIRQATESMRFAFPDSSTNAWDGGGRIRRARG